MRMTHNNNIYTSLKLKESIVHTKGECFLNYLKSPDGMLDKETILEFIPCYINSPSKTSYKHTIRIKLVLDSIVQKIRGLIKLMLVDRAEISFMLLSTAAFLSDKFLLLDVLIILIFFALKMSKHIFYTVDNAIAIISTLKSAISGASLYFASSYLKVTKIRSDKFDFLYFDKNIDDESKTMYEEWVEEILSKFNLLENFKFNICIVNENSNVMEESRKMTGIYDTPYKKSYENSKFLLGLYSSATATVICKNVSESYLKDLRNEYEKLHMSEDILHFSKDSKLFKKYQLYHEIGHLITMDLNSILLEEEKYINIFNEERDLLYPVEGDYFNSNIKEYLAESLCRYLLEGRVGDKSVGIDYEKTYTYKMISNYVLEVSNI